MRSIEAAVKNVADEILRRRLFTERIESESLLRRELVACILSSRAHQRQVEVGLRALEKAGLFTSNQSCLASQSVIVELLSSAEDRGVGGYPYPKQRGAYVARTLQRLYRQGQGIRGMLKGSATMSKRRRKLVDAAVGVGPKQASLFLRNSGWGTALAVLDRHVLSYLRAVGVAVIKQPEIANLEGYEGAEDIYCQYAKSISHRPVELDLAIWVVNRVRTAMRA